MPVYYLEPGSPPVFPDPRESGEEGLLAAGGDLSVERLCAAYDRGIFPWYAERELPLWWSPDPRAVLEPEDLHVSRSLERRLHRGGFELTWNRCFREVVVACGENRDDGTWIHPEVVEAYDALHGLGHAHSLEVWIDGRLAGGIYGVQRGAFFAAESKFHRVRDASKIALVACVRSLAAAGLHLFDVQHRTPYLTGFGVKDLRRAVFLERLRRALEIDLDLEGLVPDWRP